MNQLIRRRIRGVLLKCSRRPIRRSLKKRVSLLTFVFRGWVAVQFTVILSSSLLRFMVTRPFPVKYPTSVNK